MNKRIRVALAGSALFVVLFAELLVAGSHPMRRPHASMYLRPALVAYRNRIFKEECEVYLDPEYCMQ